MTVLKQGKSKKNINHYGSTTFVGVVMHLSTLTLSKATSGLNGTIDQMDLTDVCITLHPIAAECVSSAIQGMFWNVLLS